MQPCNLSCQDRPSWSRRADSTGQKISRSQKIVILFFAIKYTNIPQERKKEHAHDDKNRENGA